jgi:hypothetical protein
MTAIPGNDQVTSDAPSMAIPLSGLRDNHTRGSVAEFLNARIHPGSQLSIVSAYFTIYATIEGKA